MKTTLECFPCFMRQALYAIRLATDDNALQEKIILKTAENLAGFDLNISPPENSVGFYGLISQLSSCTDPFADLKRQSTNLALRIKPRIAGQINNSTDPLSTAVNFAMAGNIVDYGAHHDFDVRQTLEECSGTAPVINDFKSLKHDLRRARKILYLADNCGEIVFDGLLIERFGDGKEITMAVKEKPIINDALYADARACGLQKLCRIITNGTGCPGTPLNQCSQAFQKTFADADIIISKGQGNFETLSEVAAPLYFLLTVKCDVVAQHLEKKANRPGLKVKNGDLVLFKNEL